MCSLATAILARDSEKDDSTDIHLPDPRKHPSTTRDAIETLSGSETVEDRSIHLL
jgi:hypothetical protein